MAISFAKYAVVVGLYLALLGAVLIFNQSVAYHEGDEFLYMGLIAAFGLIVMPISAAIYNFGVRKGQRTVPLFQRYELILCMLLFLTLPAIWTYTYKGFHSLAPYGVSIDWTWSSGSMNFNEIKLHGETRCFLDSRDGVGYEDKDGDNIPDIVTHSGSHEGIIYFKPNAAKGHEFEGCPSLGG